MRGISVLVFGLGLMGAGPVQGQAVEVRVGAAVGNHAPAAAGLQLEPGPSFAVAVELPLRAKAALYGGYDRASFGCGSGFCAAQEVTVTSSGFGTGLRLVPWGPAWMRAGLTFQATEVSTGGERHRSDPAIGYELGGGLSLPVLPRLELLTGVAYRSRPDPETRTTVLSLDVGARVNLGRRRNAAGGPVVADRFGWHQAHPVDAAGREKDPPRD